MRRMTASELVDVMLMSASNAEALSREGVFDDGLAKAFGLDFGLVEMSDSGQLVAYREKPSLEHYVSMGVNVVDPSTLELISEGEKLDMPDLHQRALAIHKKALGPEHLSTAKSLNDLALLYSEIGNYAKAAPLYERALAIKSNPGQ